MNNVLKYGVFWYFTFAAVLYFVLWASLPISLLIDLMNGLFLGIAVAVIMVLFPLVKRSIRTREFDRVSQLTMGMFVVWVALTILRGYSVWHRSTSGIWTIVNSPVISFASWLAIVGGVLYITAPGMVGNELKYNRKYLLLVVALGIIFAITAFAMQSPNL